MRLDLLIQALRDQIARERAALRRLTRALMPVLLAPVGFALAQMVSSWVGLGVGLLIAGTVLMQIELFLRPFLQRCRSAERDARCYLALAPPEPAPAQLALPYALPSLLVIVASLALFLPTMLAGAAVWQRLVALGLGLVALWMIWTRVAEVVLRLARADARLARAQNQIGVPEQPAANLWRDGLLDPHLAQRVAGLPLPALRLSPAAQALLRVEAYLLLSERPGCTERELREALNDLGQQAHQDELDHAALPPVGGKIYMPIDAAGVLAHLLAGSVRRLGMDGAYSATLRTWLVRLPPARSYRVAGRLIDALIALRLPPSDSVLPFHLTVQGDLGQEARALSIIYLAASPLLFSERPGAPGRDERSFIMRGGGVLDDLDGRGRLKGPRTDFVDGFLIVGRTSFDAVEHLIGHTVNLRVKQVLAFGLLAALCPPERRTASEQAAAAHYAAFQRALVELLARYDLADALEIDWLDGSWSAIWAWIERMSAVKERDAAFLEQAQELRDRALDALERLRLERV
jgi:hypothetical protein